MELLHCQRLFFEARALIGERHHGVSEQHDIEEHLVSGAQLRNAAVDLRLIYQQPEGRVVWDFQVSPWEGPKDEPFRELYAIALRVALAGGSTARAFEQPVLSTLKKA